ncbi:MAG: GvpL/GvpF family gas vesicle protein [Marinifilaceae bacterium]
MRKKDLYIYGIIQNDFAPDLFVELEEIGVYTIPYRNVSAVVTEMKRVDMKRLDKKTLARLLVNHQKTIENVMKIGFSGIIPLRLGTFSASREEVKVILERGYDLINEIAQKARNLIEVDITSSWMNFPKLLQTISQDPEILKQKEEIVSKKSSVTQADQLKLGLMVKNKIDEEKEKCAKSILNFLQPFTVDYKSHEVMNDEMVTNTAFMVEKARLDDFDTTLEQLDEAFNGEMNFKYIGPLPCYSFYTLEIKELKFEQVEEARNELGLSECATSKEIKQAYHGKVKINHPDVNPEEKTTLSFNRLNKAYQTLLDYAVAVRQSSQEDQLFFKREKVLENSLLVKIKE